LYLRKGCIGENYKLRRYDNEACNGYFCRRGLKFFGIDKKVRDIGSTELLYLKLRTCLWITLFLMEDDSYIHFEFQTSDKGIKDLRRFRTYEALLNMQTGKDVVTYVVYSGDIKNPLSGYESGIILIK
jgi:hypothetical protein